MGTARFGGARLAAERAGASWRLPARVLAVRSLGCLVALFVAVLVLAPASASAEPLCTDTWTGPNEGTWQTAANWSTEKVPSSTDVACIEAGKTVKVTEGTNQAGVLEDKGTLVISGGSLEVVSALEVSTASALTQIGGTLKGAATLDVQGSLRWENGVMSGTGSTVITSGASATLGPGNPELTGRSFVNEGSLVIGSPTTLHLAEGAQVHNSGTFKIEDEASPAIKLGGTVIQPLFVNTGTFEKSTIAGTTEVEGNFENEGTINAQVGTFSFRGSNLKLAGGSKVKGNLALAGTSATAGSFEATGGSVALSAGSLTISSGSTASVESYSESGEGGTSLSGAGTLKVTSSITWAKGLMSGSGTTVVAPSASGSLGSGNPELTTRTFVNEGSLVFASPGTTLHMAEGAVFKNLGTVNVENESSPAIKLGSTVTAPLFVNVGLFKKTTTSGTVEIEPDFENLGTIKEEAGKFKFLHPVSTEPSTQYGGSENPSVLGHPNAKCGDPVSCATGNYSETQTDLAVGGRGVGLNLTRTYNSQAGAEGTKGAFGYGWSSSFSDHLVVNKTSKVTTLFQANGSAVPFTEGTGGSFTAPAWTQDTLSGTSEAGYTLTFASQIKYKFAGASGRLESVTDRDGNATTLTYPAS